MEDLITNEPTLPDIAESMEALETPVEEMPTEIVAEDVVEDVAEDADEIIEDATDESAEEVVEDAVKEEAPVKEVEIPVFADAPEEFEAQVTEIIAKYDLTPDLQAAIEALRTRTNVTELADYGTIDDVKQHLDRINLINSDRMTPAGIRPNTDQFVQTLPDDRKLYMFYDLAQSPSQQYPGLTMAQEWILSEFGEENQPVKDVLGRYETIAQAIKTGSFASNIPAYIPAKLHEAYRSIPEDVRQELDVYGTDDPDDPIFQSRMQLLEQVQKGLDSDRANLEREKTTVAQQQQAFNANVEQKETAFYSALRDSFTSDLTKNVTFSTDPKMQEMFAAQHVSLLAEALDESSVGDWARARLENAGIKLDMVKAKQLTDAVRTTAATIASHEKALKSDGTPLDPVALNKARSDFARVTKQFRDLGENVIKQMANVTSATPKVETKQPIKARVLPKGNASEAQKPKFTLPPMGDPTRLEKMAEQALKSAARNGW